MKPEAKERSFSSEPFVLQRAESLYSFNEDGTGFREQTFAIAVQSDAALRNFSVLAMSFAGASERVVFRYARVRHPDGTVVETAVDSAIEQPEQVTIQAPLYSDLKQKQLPVKGLRLGDTLEWQVHVERTKPESPGEFWGQHSFIQGAVVLAEAIELRLPQAKAVQVWTNPRAAVQPVTSSANGQRVYRWETKTLKPTVGPEAEAETKARKTRLLTAEEDLDAQEGKLPDLAWTTFTSWEAVGAWYRSLEAGRAEPDAAITAKVKELTEGKTTPEAKAQAVYSFVSGQIRYVGIDLGIGRYQPHRAAEVLDNQYGDCKDKHTLLASMLGVLGLHADAVLIGASVRFNPAVPSPAAFNHLITRVQIDGKDAWLDATEEVAPWRMMIATLRDKQVLVVPAVAPASVGRTPANPPFATSESMTAKGSLDAEGVAESHMTITMRGDEELVTRIVLRQVTAAQYDQLAQNIVGSMGFAGTVSHARFIHADDTAQPLIMEYDYHRDKPGDDWDNLRIIPQLLPTLLPTVDEKEPPVGSFYLVGARMVTSSAELKLPTGWSAEPPPAIHQQSEFGTYDLTFRYDKGILFAERRWTVSMKKVPQKDWKAYKTWRDSLTPRNSEPYVQLSKASTAVSPASGTAISSAPTPEIAGLMRQVGQAFQAGHFEEARQLLDKVSKLDASSPGLWGGYGFLETQAGRNEEALRLYKKEIELHPQNVPVYQALAATATLLHRPEEALPALRKLVETQPDQAPPLLLLMRALLDARLAAEAAKAGEAGVAHIPESDARARRYGFFLARRRYKAGKRKRGLPLLRTVIQQTSNAILWNDAAYELARAGVDLAFAESTQRDALARLSEQSASLTLDTPPAQANPISASLAALWDTMGTILNAGGQAGGS